MALVFREPEGLVKQHFTAGIVRLVALKTDVYIANREAQHERCPHSHEPTIPNPYCAATCTRAALQFESSSKYTFSYTKVNCAVLLYLFAPLLGIQQATVLKAASSSAHLLMEAYKACGYSKLRQGIECSDPQVYNILFCEEQLNIVNICFL